MIRNYLKIALRNLRKYQLHTLINLTGMTVGVAAFLFILLYVQDELSYEHFFSKKQEIFRLTDSYKNAVGGTVAVPPKWAAMVRNEFPEVLQSTRIRTMDLFPPLLAVGDIKYHEANLWYVDSVFFQMFDFEFLEGSAAAALAGPDALIFSEKTAKKYFGDQPALGKTVLYENKQLMQVRGVVRVPSNTHLQFDALRNYPSESGWWARTYFLLQPGTDAAALAQKAGAFLKKNYGERDAQSFNFEPQLQALTDIHLATSNEYELGEKGSYKNIFILSLIAILVLLLASINFANLSTARSTLRATELGMRKVLGANRRQLAVQFLSESLLLVGISILLALLVVELFLPGFNAFTGKSLELNFNAKVLLVLLATLFGVGLLAGSYPALLLSSFRPLDILRSKTFPNGRDAWVRRTLVVGQFAVSAALLIGTCVIYQQVRFMQEKPTGYSSEMLIGIASRNNEMNRRSETVKAEFMSNPAVVNVAFAQSLPGRHVTSFRYTLPGNEPATQGLTAFAVDQDFVRTMGIELLAGKEFSELPGKDSASFLLNEAAVKLLGWEEPLGKKIGVDYFDKWGEVTGIVRDFHFATLHSAIEPAVIQVMPPGFFSNIVLRLRTDDVPGTLAWLKTKWAVLNPDYPFEYRFIDEDMAGLYSADLKLGQLFGLFAGLAVFIACLGILGLATFSTSRRKKEIGIRKILGATTVGLVGLLSKDFLKLVIIALVIASPLAYFFMEKWLSDFAYRIDISWWVFALAGMAAAGVAFLTVGFQSVKAALANPVESLRSE